MQLIRYVLVHFILTTTAFTQWQSIGAADSVSFPTPQEVVLYSGSALLHVAVLTPELIRVRLAPTGTFEADVSWAVVKTDWPRLHPQVLDRPHHVTINTSGVSVQISKDPIRLTFYDADGMVLNEDHHGKGMAWSGREVRVWKVMPQEEHYLGFGEKAGRLQRKHTHMTMWNTDIPAYRADTDPLYQTIPFFCGIQQGRAYGIFFDNSYRSSFDMGKESHDQYSFGAEDGELNYYFFGGPTPSKVIEQFTELVGRMPLPPLWSLGYQQCRWSYSPESRVREIAAGFRSRNIPADVIYLDIDYMEGYRIFTWNPDRFPDPRKLIRDLREDGFRVAVIVDPGIKADSSYHAYRTGLDGDHFLKYPDGTTFIGKVWPGECAFPDFSNAATRTWWGENFAGLVQDGVRGWWNDMNEPSVFDIPTKTVDLTVLHSDEGRIATHAKHHNLYGLQMTKATYEGVRKLLPTERLFVLTRASYAGGHRYSAAWTGDNVASWEHLAMSVAMCLNLSVSGQPFVGPDIGGFIGYPSGELFARWLQAAVFMPLMRAHSVINEKNKEPWEYGDEYTTINRKTIELRYRLLPLIYNEMFKASVTGIPPMRPMLFQYPNNHHFHWEETQFMFGDDLLIAPVLWEGARSRELRLPEGKWYDFYTGEEHEGDRRITVEAQIDRIPVFARAAAIIPSRQVVQHTDEAPIDPLTLTVFPLSQGSSSTVYYEDDGLTFAYEKGEYMKRSIEQRTDGATITLRVSKPAGTFVPPKRTLVVRFMGVDSPPSHVTVNGRGLPATTRSQRAWTYDSEKKTLMVHVEDRMAEIVIKAQQ